MAGKGSRFRAVDTLKFGANYDRIFNQDKTPIKMNKEWEPSQLENAKSLRPLEFQDIHGEWQYFELLKTKTRIVFGGCCNVGFIESGYIEREDGETLDETLQEMLENLETYYNEGPKYTTRIVCNERM